jgi:hypothetical protein
MRKRLERDCNPRDRKADVRYIPSSGNRSHRDASLGGKLDGFCSGTRFRYVLR